MKTTTTTKPTPKGKTHSFQGNKVDKPSEKENTLKLSYKYGFIT